MAKQLFANNASALLAASISDTDLTIQVAAGYGALYPNPGAGEFFIVALENSDGDIEFCKIESRSTDLLTVASGGRGQDGSSAQSWTNGQTRVEVRATKGSLDRFLQREGDVMSGNLDMDNNNIIDARLTGDWRGTNGQLVGTTLRGTLDDDSNEIVVPAGGARATAGGEKILVETDEALVRAAAFEVGMIMQWFGAAIDVPAGWKLCNGANGTPDMRNFFLVGAGSTYAVGATGGALSATSTAAGAHTPVVQPHTLVTAEVPAASITLPVTLSGIGSADGGSGTGNVLVTGNNTPSSYPTDGGDGPHSHDADAVGNHTHDVATLPPYKALYFIMFTG